MIKVHYEYSKYRGYYTSQDSAAAGAVFVGDEVFTGLRLLSMGVSWKDKEEWLNGLAKANGFFFLVCGNGNRLIAAVDHLRSIPLFYAVKNHSLFLSDSAEWVRKEAGETIIDEVSKQEFLFSGYVSGRDTLFDGVKQLQASEVLIAECNGEKLDISITSYQFRGEGQEEIDKEDPLVVYNNTLQRVFARMAVWLKGRHIVVPLNGGYDGRLLVFMLKLRGLTDNVTVFSYGKKGGEEALAHEYLARKLSLKWHFIPYTGQLWQEWAKSKQHADYLNMSAGYSVLPNTEDWPAVWEMKRRCLLPRDTVFLSGATLPFTAETVFGSGVNDIVSAIIKKHYCLWPWKLCPGDVQSRIKEKLCSELAEIEVAGNDDDMMLAKLEAWERRERQAKYAANAVRTYEFWGYHWWLPFEDRELVQTLSCLPLLYRLNKRIYKDCGEKVYRVIAGENSLAGGKTKLLRHASSSSPAKSLIQSFFRRFGKMREAYREVTPLGIYGQFGKGLFQRSVGQHDYRSLLARQYIETVKTNAQRWRPS